MAKGEKVEVRLSTSKYPRRYAWFPAVIEEPENRLGFVTVSLTGEHKNRVYLVLPEQMRRKQWF